MSLVAKPLKPDWFFNSSKPFSQSARCGADNQQALERLCRHITRPAVAKERVQCNAAGQVVPGTGHRGLIVRVATQTTPPIGP